MNWLQYLPPIFQEAAFYETILFCWCGGYIVRTFPKAWQTQPVFQLVVLAVGLGCGASIISKSVVYGLGAGLVAATIAMIGYDLFLQAIVSGLTAGVQKLLRALGLVSNPSAPTPTVDQSMISKMPPNNPSQNSP